MELINLVRADAVDALDEVKALVLRAHCDVNAQDVTGFVVSAIDAPRSRAHSRAYLHAHARTEQPPCIMLHKQARTTSPSF